jgi:hypothetical protein
MPYILLPQFLPAYNSLLEARQTLTGGKTDTYWKQDRHLLEARQTLTGSKTDTYWKQDSHLLEARHLL